MDGPVGGGDDDRDGGDGRPADVIPRRVAVAYAIGLIAIGLAAIAAHDIYVDYVRQGEPLGPTFLEHALAVPLVAVLALAAYWVLTRFDRREVTRMSRWFGAMLAAVVGVVALVQAVQYTQATFKPHIAIAYLVSFCLLAALLVGRYDAARAERNEALRAERDRFAALFENVPTPVVGISVEDDGERIATVNPAFERVFGYDEASVTGRDLQGMLRPPDEEPEPVDFGAIDELPAAEFGDWETVRTTLETDSGRREFVRLSAPVEEAPVDQDAYAFYVDVTERIQREERLRVLSRTLRHDLRNRLNVVRGRATMLEDRAEDRTERIVGEIKSAADELISRGERVRKIEQTVAESTEPRPVDVCQVVDRRVGAAQSAYPDARFEIETPDAAWVAGTSALGVAVEHLVENAVEHHEGDGTPVVEVSVEGPTDGTEVELRVADNGPGIPAREYEVLTGEREHSQRDHSTGLGLWLVSWVVRSLGGDVGFDTDGEGSVVVLRVPATAPPSDGDDTGAVGAVS